MRMNCLHGHPSRLAFLAVVLAAASHTADGQPAVRRPQANADTVRLAADLFLRAVADERWQVAASMVDTTLMRFIVAQRIRWQRQVTPPDLTIEDFMHSDPAKPRAVAEYELKRYRERTSPTDGDAVASEFAGTRSLLELSRLSALEATSRYLQAQDTRVQMREAARRAGCGDSTSRVPASLRRIVGVAMPADSIAYVLHEDGAPHDETDGLPRLEPMVIQLRLRANSWVIIPGNNLLRGPNAVELPIQCDAPRRPSS